VTESERNARIDAEVEAIREEYAEEEAEAAEAEIAEKNAALDTPLNLRITSELDTQLRRRATAEQIPTSALVRRLLTQAVHDYSSGGLSEAEVEAIARRVVREEVDRS
jgi:predicted HicB family RNase H-like nuclease